MRSIISLFEGSVKKFPNNTYLWQKTGSKFEGLSYIDTQKAVHTFAAGLMQLGLQHGDHVTLLAEGRNEWVISELGILYNGAVNVPLSVKLNEPEEIAFRLKHSGSRIAITSQRQLQKILAIADSVDCLETIICFDKVDTNDKRVKFYEDIYQAGKEFLKTNSQAFRDRYKSVKEDDDANICYTSGTTADPKGIILTHRNYTANVEQAGSLHDIPEYYTTLLILPWDHSFAHTCGIYSLMKYGASIASIELGTSPMDTLKNIPKNIKEIKPSIILSVPALAKNFKKNIEKAITDKGGIAEKLFRASLKVAYSYNGNAFNRGKGFKALLSPLNKVFDIILFKKIREGFGGNLKFFVGGGALLDIELQRFFFAIGIPMYQGYGLSESAPVISSNGEKAAKMGSSGRIAAGIDLKICDNDGNELPIGEKGEIIIQGENVMKGYWGNKTATAETLKNGWLYTGDMGYMDKDGFLYVLGRFKSLLIADDGEKFSPEGIEEAFTDNSKLIHQCMMYNDQQPYSICLVVPNMEAIHKMAKKKKGKLDVQTVLQHIEQEFLKYRTGGEYDNMFPQRWLPVALGIIAEGFSEENHLINSTLKMVRPKITERYQDLLDYLYTPEAKKINNSHNLSEIEKLMG